MAIERARVRAVQKPWGVSDLLPWSKVRPDTGSIGELWYERGKDGESAPLLLLKLLATTEPLSIQVHPDDAFARTIGLPCGKTEAWYVLSARPDSKVALGLTNRISKQRLRQAIGDGSIAELVRWKSVTEGEVVFVPAGTIHAIGPGLVVAEIQQRSDATFRMFDYGRQRALHADNAVAVADTGPASVPEEPERYTDARTILVVDAHFIVERIELSPNSTWTLCAERESWLFVVRGSARLGSLDLSIADVVFAEDERGPIDVGPHGLIALVAYPGAVVAAALLAQRKDTDAALTEHSADPFQALTSSAIANLHSDPHQ